MVSLASAAAQVEVHLVRRVCEQSAVQSLQRRVRGKCPQFVKEIANSSDCQECSEGCEKSKWTNFFRTP